MQKVYYPTRYKAIINRKPGECTTIRLNGNQFVNLTWDEYGKYKKEKENNHGTR